MEIEALFHKVFKQTYAVTYLSHDLIMLHVDIHLSSCKSFFQFCLKKSPMKNVIKKKMAEITLFINNHARNGRPSERHCIVGYSVLCFILHILAN